MPSSKSQKGSFSANVIRTILFLDAQKIEYFILGGVAVGVHGEPRFTYDLDLDLFIPKDKVPFFLTKAKKALFKVGVKEAIRNVQNFGTFRMFVQDLQVDVILASTELEKSALERSRAVKLFGRSMQFPSPEDLILLKIIPGRAKDLMDAESIVLRHKNRLDADYLKKWAQKISDEAENYRVWQTLQKLLKVAAG